MATGQLNGVIRHLRRVTLLTEGGGMTDGQLLECFVTGQDEAAFETLVRRHGPMVLGVCRRVLHHAQDAEDAFQAAFFVLARKAASIKQRELLGNWLYGVAYRAALEVNAARRTRERQMSVMPEAAVVAEADVWSDLRPILDEELSHLPDKYRVPVVLCDLEGRTRREVAQQLGIPEGTLSSRLATARRTLAEGLARRGVTLLGGALAAVLSQGVASASLPPSLVVSVTKAATQVAARSAAASVFSAKVAAITEGVLKTMFLSKLKNVTAVLLACLAIGGTVLLAFHAAAAHQEGDKPAINDGRPAAGALAQPEKPPAVQPPGQLVFVESDSLETVAFSRDNRLLACGGQDKTVMLWLMPSKQGDQPSQTWEVPNKGIVRRVAFSPDNKVLAVGVDGAAIYLWDIEKAKLEATLQANLPSQPDSLGNNGSVNSIVFLPGGKLAALYTYRPNDGNENTQAEQIVIWDLKNKTSVTLAELKRGTLVDLAASPDGKFLAATMYTSGLKVWDVERREVVWQEKVGKNDFMSRVAFSPDGKTLAVGGGYLIVDGVGVRAEARLWAFDVKTRKQLWRVEEPANGAYNAVSFTADSKGVLTGSSGKDVKYRLKGGRPASKILSELRRWDVATGKEVWRAEGELGWFGAIVASADGKALAGCDSSHLMLFDPATGRRQSVLMKATKGQLE